MECLSVHNWTWIARIIWELSRLSTWTGFDDSTMTSKCDMRAVVGARGCRRHHADAFDHTDAFDLFLELNPAELRRPFPARPAGSRAIPCQGLHTHLYGKT